MTTTRRAVTAVMTGLALTLIGLIATASAAFAQVPPPEPTHVIAPPTPTVSVVSYGSPIWLFALVAATAIAMTIAAVLTVQKQHHLPYRRTSHA